MFSFKHSFKHEVRPQRWAKYFAEGRSNPIWRQMMVLMLGAVVALVGCTLAPHAVSGKTLRAEANAQNSEPTLLYSSYVGGMARTMAKM